MYEDDEEEAAEEELADNMDEAVPVVQCGYLYCHHLYPKDKLCDDWFTTLLKISFGKIKCMESTVLNK